MENLSIKQYLAIGHNINSNYGENYNIQTLELQAWLSLFFNIQDTTLLKQSHMYLFHILFEIDQTGFTLWHYKRLLISWNKY